MEVKQEAESRHVIMKRVELLPDDSTRAPSRKMQRYIYDVTLIM